MKSAKKIILITTLAYMSSLAPLATDMYLPAMNDIALQLRASEFYAQLSLTAFFVAFSLGQLIYGPLSDIFGRKKPILAGVAIFTLASIACIFVDNIAVFIALRFCKHSADALALSSPAPSSTTPLSSKRRRAPLR